MDQSTESWSDGPFNAFFIEFRTYAAGRPVCQPRHATSGQPRMRPDQGVWYHSPPQNSKDRGNVRTADSASRTARIGAGTDPGDRHHRARGRPLPRKTRNPPVRWRGNGKSRQEVAMVSAPARATDGQGLRGGPRRAARGASRRTHGSASVHGRMGHGREPAQPTHGLALPGEHPASRGPGTAGRQEQVCADAGRDWTCRIRAPASCANRAPSRRCRTISFATGFLKPTKSGPFAAGIRREGHSLRQLARRPVRLVDEATRQGASSSCFRSTSRARPRDHYFVEGFMDRDGRVCGMLARRRIRMYPKDFGNSTSTETHPSVGGVERRATA